MNAWRAALLHFDADGRAQRIDDALLVVDDGRIVDAGEHARLAPAYPQARVTDWRGLVLAPGFVDPHLHYPQLDVIGSPADGLLDWLARYTFPHEARFGDAPHAQAVAHACLDELLRHGVTSAMAFCSAHPASVDAFFAAALARRLRMIAGLVLMDRGAPDTLCAETLRSLVDSDDLIRRWHGAGRLGYALAPRFAPTCTGRLLAGAAELADAHPGVLVQTHLAENHDEIAWVMRLFPQARSYLDVYASHGLLRPGAVFAHCLHLDDDDRRRIAAAGAWAAVCPTSNLFLGSGLFDFAAAARTGLRWALASDVGAGTSLSPFRTMLAAFEVARLAGATLAPGELWRAHTLEAARALRIDHAVGNLAPGLEADFIALDGAATPMLARRTAAAGSLDEWLFAMIVLGDDRAVRHVVVGGEAADTVRNPAAGAGR